MTRNKRRSLLAVRMVSLKKLGLAQALQLNRALRDEAAREALIAGVCSVMEGKPGAPTVTWGDDGLVEDVQGEIIDSLLELLNYILANWEEIAKVILFIIGLFAQPDDKVAAVCCVQSGPKAGMAPYPDDVGAAISEVIRIIGSGQFAEEKAALGLAVWNVQGFLQRMILGDPKVALSHEQYVQLQEVRAVVGKYVAKPMSAAEAGSVPSWIWDVLRALLDMLEKILS